MACGSMRRRGSGEASAGYTPQSATSCAAGEASATDAELAAACRLEDRSATKIVASQVAERRAF